MANKKTLQDKINKLEALRSKLHRERDSSMPFFIIFPIIATIIASVFASHPVAIGFVAFVSAFISYGIYYSIYTVQFDRIKSNFKSELISNFMKIYHPDIHYSYSLEENKGGSIINSSPLASESKPKVATFLRL